MSTTGTAVARDRKVMLSTLWVVAMLNYIYADVFTLFFDRDAIREIETGSVGDIHITQGFVLMWAIIMETAIVMVVLRLRAAAAWSLSGAAQPFYVFFATVEISCTLFIVGYAWTWRQPAPLAASAPEQRQHAAAGP